MCDVAASETTSMQPNSHVSGDRCSDGHGAKQIRQLRSDRRSGSAQTDSCIDVGACISKSGDGHSPCVSDVYVLVRLRSTFRKQCVLAAEISSLPELHAEAGDVEPCLDAPCLRSGDGCTEQTCTVQRRPLGCRCYLAEAMRGSAWTVAACFSDSVHELQYVRECTLPTWGSQTQV